MMNVYREILPDSYLLILIDAQPTSEVAALQRALQRAQGSGKTSVWVDCSELHHPSSPVIELLSEFHRRLGHQHIQLVVCHLESHAQQVIQQLPTDAQPLILETLLDASLYCRNLAFSHHSAA